MTWVRFWRAENSNYVNCDYGGSHNYYDRGDDIYIMMKCLFVGVSRKMITFLKGLSVNHSCSRWFHGFSWFLVSFHGFSRWFHGFSWFFMVFGWFPWFFKVVSWFFMVFG